jgi:phenylalanyl-tRNA synthetase beta chain
LIPSLLAVKAHNEAHGNLDVDLFEIANVYLPKSGQALPDEPTRLTLLSDRDFLGLKGIVEAVLARFHLEKLLVVRPSESLWFTPGRSAELFLGETSLGRIGELDRSKLDVLEVRTPCSAAELTLSVLVEQADLVPRHHPLPPLPVVARDLSLVVARTLPWAELAGVVGRAGGSTLESIVYLDSFRGGNIPDDRQSLHFGLRFRHPERTLTGEEVEKAVQSIVEACSTRFEATLRG